MKCRDHAIHLAIEEAMQSEHKTRHGSVVYKQGKIIQSGRNQYCAMQRLKHFKTNPIWSIHAEMNVIAGLPKGITKGATIVIVKVNRDGRLSNSKPCSICTALIRRSGINKIIYTSGPDSIIETCI